MSSLDNVVADIFTGNASTVLSELKDQDVLAFSDFQTLTETDLEKVLDRISGTVVRKSKFREACLPHIKKSAGLAQLTN